jgi:hypothetical protein
MSDHAMPAPLHPVDDLLGRRTRYEHEKASIETLVLGDAHAQSGFDPAGCPGAFNMATLGQDLKYSFLLYDTLHAGCPRLKCIVVFHSVFSAGFLAESVPSMRNLCVLMNELFGLGIEYEDPVLAARVGPIRERLSQRAAGQGAERARLSAGDGPSGGLAAVREDPLALAARLRVPGRGRDAEVFLARILVLARHLGHRVVIVTPSPRADLRLALGDDLEPLLSDLREMIADHAPDMDLRWVNGLATKPPDDQDFADCRLLRAGSQAARSLTAQIAEQLR